MVETRKIRKRPTNRLENLKMKIKPMTLQKKQLIRKTAKTFTVRFVRSHQTLTSVQCVTSLFMLVVDVTVKTVRVSD